MQKKQTTVIKFNGNKIKAYTPKSAGNKSLRKHNQKLELRLKDKKNY